MIPKIIHHVWPGSDPFKEKFHNWRTSWMKHHPDWTFYFWRLDNLPTNISPAVLEILKDSDYAITPKADVLRFEVVRIFGGIYVDTDFECLKPFDDFLHHRFFSGWEDDNRRICPSLFGAEPGNSIITNIALTSAFNAKSAGAKQSNDRPNVVTSVKPFTVVLQHNLDNPGVVVYPRDYFYPIFYKERDRLGEECPNAYAKHYWSGMDSDGWCRAPKFDTDGDVVS
jgi:mannosyltransferase OCH1-like enzyme